MISYCGFVFTSLKMSDVEHLFICLYVFFGKMSVQIFCPFLKFCCLVFMLSCTSSLHILDINPLLDISFTSIFYLVDFFFLFR